MKFSFKPFLKLKAQKSLKKTKEKQFGFSLSASKDFSSTNGLNVKIM